MSYMFNIRHLIRLLNHLRYYHNNTDLQVKSNLIPTPK